MLHTSLKSSRRVRNVPTANSSLVYSHGVIYTLGGSGWIFSIISWISLCFCLILFSSFFSTLPEDHMTFLIKFKFGRFLDFLLGDYYPNISVSHLCVCTVPSTCTSFLLSLGGPQMSSPISGETLQECKFRVIDGKTETPRG